MEERGLAGGGAMAERLNGVLVAGAGPVGLVTALRLARAGIQVVVVDAAPGIIQEPRAVVYHSPVVERLDRLGLLDDLKEIGLMKQEYRYWTLDHRSLGGISFKEALRPEDTDYPYNLHLGQPMLAGVIQRHLEATPGAEIRWSHRVVGVAQDEDSITATIDTPDGSERIRADWLIGADGARSGVRKALGLTLEGVTWPEWFVATNVDFDFAAHGFGQSNIVHDPEHWAIIPKIDQGRLWRCTYREEPGMAEDEIRCRMPERYALFHPDLADIEPDSWSPYRVHDRTAERYRVGRALLAGDAAHLINPIGGLGLTGGLLDAIALGDALVAVIEGRRGEAALDFYAAERKRVFEEIVAPTAKENRRRISESDPARQAADYARLASLAEPEAARKALLAVTAIVGRDPVEATA